MNSDEYSRRRAKLRLHIYIGKWAERAIANEAYMRARRKLNKFIRRGQRAYSKLEVGQI